MRLVLITDRVGVPVGYMLVPANEKEYEPVRELTTAQAGCLLIADKGYWGREYAETLALQGVTSKHPTVSAPPTTSPARNTSPCGW